LNPLVTSVIDNASLQINTNPVEVYKQWVNQTEAETGVTRWLTSRLDYCNSLSLSLNTNPPTHPPTLPPSLGVQTVGQPD